MKELNDAVDEGLPYCRCETCAESDRAKFISYDDKECKFIPWMEKAVAACGLTVWDRPAPDDHAKIKHMECPYIGVYDLDCHIVRMGSSDKWEWLTYGSKLWKAAHVQDKELEKLFWLFKILESDYSNSQRKELIRVAKMNLC